MRAERLTKVFAAGRAGVAPALGRSVAGTRIAAVDGIDLAIGVGEAVGIVGESGSGKTTVARCLLGLTKPTSGAVSFNDAAVTNLRGKDLKAFRRQAQIVFQDPFASLDPRFTVLRAISEPLLVHRICPRAEIHERAASLLRKVGLTDDLLRRHRHELSGGEAQRVTIARALATNPSLLILDEPTSALDASARLHVISLLRELRSALGLTYLVISHDLNTVRYLCERVLVMYRGRVVEEGPAAAILGSPRHPYTRALVAALPSPSLATGQARVRLKSAVDVPVPAGGCALVPRCPYATDACTVTFQELAEVAPRHSVACRRVADGELDPADQTPPVAGGAEQ